MTNRPTTLERAFEIARSGSCASVSNIADQLALENKAYMVSQLHGPALRKQLNEICKESYRGEVPEVG